MSCTNPLGRAGALLFEYPEGSTSYLALLGTTSIGGDISPTLVDVTDFNDAGKKRECPVEIQMTNTIDINILPGDPVYNMILTNLLNLDGNKLYRFDPGDGKIMSGAYNVSSFSWTLDKNDVIKASIGVNSSGDIARA